MIKFSALAFAVIGSLLAVSANAQDSKAPTSPTIKFTAATPDYVRNVTIDSNGSITAKEYTADGVHDISIDIRASSIITTRKDAVSEVRTVIDLSAAAAFELANPLKAADEVRAFEFSNRQFTPSFTLEGLDVQNKANCNALAMRAIAACNIAISACGQSGGGSQACVTATTQCNNAQFDAFRCFSQTN